MTRVKFAFVGLAVAALTTTAFAQDKMDSMPGMKPGMKDHMSGMHMKPAEAGKDAIIGTGTVKGVDAARHVVTLNHDPIKSIDWPAMTMDFPVASGVDLTKVKPGQQVEFGLTKSGSDYTISSLKPKS